MGQQEFFMPMRSFFRHWFYWDMDPRLRGDDTGEDDIAEDDIGEGNIGGECIIRASLENQSSYIG